MHKLIHMLTGVEIIADDFVVLGFGETFKDAHRSHDHNFIAFIFRVVPFVGHTATYKGRCVNPKQFSREVCCTLELTCQR